MPTSLWREDVLSKRPGVALEALASCESADRIAHEAMDCVGKDDERMFALLERRDEVLMHLAEHIVSLRLERPTADGMLLAATERDADAAEDLVAALCSAMDVSQRTTATLALRVAERVAELRAELAGLQRGDSALSAYAPARVNPVVDSLR